MFISNNRVIKIEFLCQWFISVKIYIKNRFFETMSLFPRIELLNGNIWDYEIMSNNIVIKLEFLHEWFNSEKRYIRMDYRRLGVYFQ